MNYLIKQLTVGTMLAAIAVSVGSSAVLADVTARHGELQAVIDAINDPDPLMRLAQLEEILRKGDATEVQLAIRTAFQLDDPNIRSLALRAHFASFRTFIIDVKLPEEITSQIDGKDTEAKARWEENGLYKFLRNQGYHFSLNSEYPSSEELEFEVRALNGNPPEDKQKNFMGTGNIRGGLLTIVTNVRNGEYGSAHCSFEFGEYVGFALLGRGTCTGENNFQFHSRIQLFDNVKSSQGD